MIHETSLRRRPKVFASGLIVLFFVGINGVCQTPEHSPKGLSDRYDPDFNIASSLSFLTMAARSTHFIALTVTALNNFTGTVQISTCERSHQLALLLNPTNQRLTWPESATSTLMVNSTIEGTFYVDVQGQTSTGLAHDLTIQVEVTRNPGFSIESDPTTLTIAGGIWSTTSITIDSVNGFGGSVSLEALPANHIMATPSLVSVGSPGYYDLKIQLDPFIKPGTYPVVVQGTSGETAHDVSIQIVVLPEFNFGASYPAPVRADGVTPANSFVEVVPLNNFDGTVTLSFGSIPSALECSPLSTTVVRDSYGFPTFSCTSTTPGVYVVTIFGTSGGLAHHALAFFTFY